MYGIYLPINLFDSLCYDGEGEPNQQNLMSAEYERE